MAGLGYRLSMDSIRCQLNRMTPALHRVVYVPEDPLGIMSTPRLCSDNRMTMRTSFTLAFQGIGFQRVVVSGDGKMVPGALGDGEGAKHERERERQRLPTLNTGV